MGFQKFKRPTLHTADAKFTTSANLSTDAGMRNPVQTISLTGASGLSGTVVSSRGFTFITSTGTGAGWTLNLAAPGRPGIEKTIFAYLSGASTVPVSVRTASSSQPFFGSTRNSITLSTVAGSSYAISVTLVSKSSVQWALKGVHGALASTAFPWITTTGATA